MCTCEYVICSTQPIYIYMRALQWPAVASCGVNIIVNYIIIVPLSLRLQRDPRGYNLVRRSYWSPPVQAYSEESCANTFLFIYPRDGTRYTNRLSWYTVRFPHPLPPLSPFWPTVYSMVPNVVYGLFSKIMVLVCGYMYIGFAQMLSTLCNFGGRLSTVQNYSPIQTVYRKILQSCE